MFVNMQMDKLSDLPTKDDVELSPQESEAMVKYFGSSEGKSKNKYKLILYATLLFLLLANPFADKALGFIPKCGNPMIQLGIKTLIFAVAFLAIVKFT